MLAGTVRGSIPYSRAMDRQDMPMPKACDNGESEGQGEDLL